MSSILPVRMAMHNAELKRITHGHLDNFLDWRQGSGDTVEILDIYVRSEDRGHGLGRRMVHQLMQDVPRTTRLIYAISRTNNIPAKQFYEAMRFRIVANLWNFYQDAAGRPANTIDAVMYGKDLIEGKDA